MSCTAKILIAERPFFFIAIIEQECCLVVTAKFTLHYMLTPLPSQFDHVLLITWVKECVLHHVGQNMYRITWDKDT